MQSDHIQFFYELSPFRPEWVAYIPRVVWVLGQILASAFGIIILLKHKEYEHISIPLGPFAVVFWLRRGNRIIGPITAYSMITWFVYSFAGMVLSAVLLDGLYLAAHLNVEARPIVMLITWVTTALLYKNLRLKVFIRREARSTVESTYTAEIPYNEIGILFSEMREKSHRREN